MVEIAAMLERLLKKRIYLLQETPYGLQAQHDEPRNVRQRLPWVNATKLEQPKVAVGAQVKTEWPEPNCGWLFGGREHE